MRLLLVALTVSAIIYAVSLGLTARLIANVAAVLSTGISFYGGGGGGGGGGGLGPHQPYTSTSLSRLVFTSIIVPTGTTLTYTSTLSRYETIRHIFNTASIDLIPDFVTFTTEYTVRTGEALPSTATYWSLISFTPQFSTLYSTQTGTYRTYVSRALPSSPPVVARALSSPPQVTAAPPSPQRPPPPPPLHVQHADAPVVKRAFTGDPRPRLRAVVALLVLMLVCFAALLANGVVCSIAVQRAEQRAQSAHRDAAHIATPAAFDHVRSAIHRRSGVSKSFAGVFAALAVLLLALGLATFVLLGVSFGLNGGLADAAVALWALSIVTSAGVIAACILDVRAARKEHNVVDAPPSVAAAAAGHENEKQSSFGHGVAPQPSAIVPYQSTPAREPASQPAHAPVPAVAAHPTAGTMYMAVSDGRGGTVMVPVQQSI